MTNELFNSLSTMDELLTKIDNGADHFYHNFKGDGIIIEAQKEIFGRNVSRSEFNCPRCVHKLYKAIAKEYIKEKNNRVSMELELLSKKEESVQTVTKKKRRRKTDAEEIKTE